jgi:CHASE3 domain sensor protein
MFNNIRTATKVLLGFALAVLVSVVVGLVGYYGIAALRVESEHLSLNLLPVR